MDMMENPKYHLHANQIEHFTYGAWQSTWDVDPCLIGILKLLGKYKPCQILLAQDLNNILRKGKAPDKWTKERHFGKNRMFLGPLHAPFICGPWYNGDGHFITFYLCKDYWTLLDPLYEDSSLEEIMHENVSKALSEAYKSDHNTSPLIPMFRKVHKLATQKDHPYRAWSCGTFAMLTCIHLVLGNKKPDEMPENCISRQNMENFHAALLEWLLNGKKPDLWEIGSLNTSVLFLRNARKWQRLPLPLW